MTRYLVFACCLLAGASASAAEGMFLLDKLPAERLKRSGLKLEPGELLRLSRAVVQVASGGIRVALYLAEVDGNQRLLAELGLRR